MNVPNAHLPENRISYIDYCDLADIKYIKNDDNCGSITAFVYMARETGITSAIESLMGAKPGGLDKFIDAAIKQLEDSGLDPLSSSADIGSLMDMVDPSKLDTSNLLEMVNDPRKLTEFFAGDITSLAKGLMNNLSDLNVNGLTGGSKRYKRSRRALPKKRRLTIRRVKLTK